MAMLFFYKCFTVINRIPVEGRLSECLNNVLNKVKKTIGLLRKLQIIFSRSTLITIYKAFVRPHLDYRDILMS